MSYISNGCVWGTNPRDTWKQLGPTQIVVREGGGGREGEFIGEGTSAIDLHAKPKAVDASIADASGA